MAIYESMLIFSGRMEPQAVDQELEKVKGLIESGSGSLHSVEKMGRRRLAYDIRKESDGHYAVLHFENEPGRIAALQRAFRLNESILRYMVFRRERLPEGPTVTIEEEEHEGHEGGYRRRDEREGRGDRDWRDRDRDRDRDRGDRGDRGERERRETREVREEPRVEAPAPAESEDASGSAEKLDS